MSRHTHADMFKGQRNISLQTMLESAVTWLYDMLIKHTTSVFLFRWTAQMQHNLFSPAPRLPTSMPSYKCVCLHVCQGVPSSGIYSWGKSDISGVTMDTVATELQYLWVGGLEIGCACTSAFCIHTHTQTHPRMQETLDHSTFLSNNHQK